MATATHTAIDGSSVVLEGDTDRGRPVTSSVRLQRDGLLRELTSAPVAALDELGFTVVESYAHAGGTLRIGERRQVDTTQRSSRVDRAALWGGRHHGVVLVQAEAPTEELLGVLDTLTITETATGVAVAGPGVVGPSTRLVKELPGVGLAEVAPLVPEVAQGLPRWSGTPVDGGELYRDEARPGVPVLVLVGESAATTVLLDHADGTEADTATTRVADLTVTWTAPDR